MLTLPHSAVMQRKRLRSSIWVQVCFLNSRSEQVACETTFSEIFLVSRYTWKVVVGALGVWVVAQRQSGVRWRSLLVSFAHGILLSLRQESLRSSGSLSLTECFHEHLAFMRRSELTLKRQEHIPPRPPPETVKIVCTPKTNAGRKPCNKDIEHGNLSARY